MSTTQSERLRALLEPLVAKAGLELEEVKVSAAGRRRQLMIVVDAEEGVQLDTVAELSRAFSQALDASDAMGETEYVLEVTSPGTDRPLTEPRHFRRNTGRLVKLQLKERGELIARIMTVDDTGLDLEVPGVKGRKPKPARADFTEITGARVEVEFNRKANGDPAGDDPLEDPAEDLADDTGETGGDAGSTADESTEEA
jgi:ribosome maturation factor RimP